jgi:putative hydrolase of the HAD superfamily
MKNYIPKEKKARVITDILFDFFGTLVHYTPGIFHTAPYERTHGFLQQHGFQLPYDTFIQTFTTVADDLEAQAKASFREYHMDDVGRSFFRAAFAGDVDDGILKPFVAHFIAEWSRGVVHLDGLSPFLTQLAGRYRLSILSNTHYPALIHEQLAAMQIAPYFARVVTSVEVGIRKPHPAIFEQTLADLQLAPEQAIYIGDTYVDDYQGANAAHLRCVLLDPQHRYLQVPDRIETVFDLVPYLEGLQQS